MKLVHHKVAPKENFPAGQRWVREEEIPEEELRDIEGEEAEEEVSDE